MNNNLLKQKHSNKLKAASKRVRQESIKVNAEFAAIETDLLSGIAGVSPLKSQGLLKNKKMSICRLGIKGDY